MLTPSSLSVPPGGSQIKLVVHNKREMWAHVLADVTRAEGVKEISFGSGKHRDKARLKDIADRTVIPYVCASDENAVYY